MVVEETQTDDARARRRRRYLTVGVPAMALGAVLLAIAAGAPPGRWWPVAAFLAVALIGALCFLITTLLMRRRAFRQRGAEVPWETPLSKPVWMSLNASGLLVEAASLLAALVAAVGFPGAGVGILLVFAAFAVFMDLMQGSMSPRRLTFESAGLRVDIGRATFLVPWATITRVERIGPDHTQIVRLHVSDVDAVMKSAAPSTPRALARVTSCIRQGSRPDGQLMLLPGTAGLDGATLARTVEAALDGRPGRAN